MLWRKLGRDIRENKGSYLACVTIITIGLMIFASFSLVMNNLSFSKDTFYSEQNFADGFVDLKAMPFSSVKELGKIDGIKDIEGRLVKDVRVLMPGRGDNIYLRLVSVDMDSAKHVNEVRLESGIDLDDEKLNIWVDNRFFAANKLTLNDQIEIIADGQKKVLTIVGTGTNPEFIYAIRNSMELFPEEEKFGIAYLPYEVMKNIFREKDTVNSIVFTVHPGYDYKNVENALENELKKYGLISIYPRKDQSSDVLLSGEMEQLQSMGTALPLLFLSVASIILYIMLKRMIENQRGQIGIIKALGYTNREVMTHYISYSLLIGIAGGILGGILGIGLSRTFTAMYVEFFNLPGLGTGFSFKPILQTLLLSLVFAGFAGYRGSRRIMNMEPAEAMRPKAPLAGKRVMLERAEFFWNMLNIQGKMALRNAFRHKGRSLFIIVGIMFSFAILGTCWAMWETTEKMMYDQYEKVEIYDLRIAYQYPLEDKETERELAGFPGVKRVESKAEIPATLVNKWKKKDVIVLGLPADSKLHKIFDDKGRELFPPSDGIMLSQRLADVLDAQVGTQLIFESPFSKDTSDRQYIEVTDIIPQFMGINAYMERSSLQKALGQGNITTSLMVSIDEDKVDILQEKYLNASKVGGIEDRKEMLGQLKELMETYSATIYIMLFFGVIIAFAIVYNSSVITVSERSRELASMMVLGMTAREVLSVITFEQWFLAVFGILGGIPLTKMFLVALSGSVSNDVYTMPSVLGKNTIFVALVINAVAIWFAQRAAARRIKSLNIADVLKAGE